MRYVTPCICLCSLALLVGCSNQAPNVPVVVSEQIAVDHETFEGPLPRFLPPGTQHSVQAVGFEASDGSFYPVLALGQPIPRGGSIKPVRLGSNQLKVVAGSDPEASNNQMLGMFDIDPDADELEIGFSLTAERRLLLYVKDAVSGQDCIQYMEPAFRAQL